MNFTRRQWAYSAIGASLLCPLGAFADDAKTDQANDKPSYELIEKQAVDVQTKNAIDLVIRGKMNADDKELPLAGRAALEFFNRVVKLGDDKMPVKSVRNYTDARARFVVAKSDDSRQLRNDRRVIVADREATDTTLWSPNGPLRTPELELINDVLDPTRLAVLLPMHPVRVDEKWDVPADAVVSLFTLDSFLSSDLKGKLVKINEHVASIEITGTVQGMNHASEMKAVVKAELTFDRRDQLIDTAVWKQEETRSASPIGPSGKYEVDLKINRTLANNQALSDELVKSSAVNPKKESMLLVYEDPANRFRFYHDRNWHITANRPEATIFRRMEGNEYVCQMNVVSLASKADSALLTKNEFQAAVSQAGGWKIDEVIESNDLPTDGSMKLHLLTAVGKAGETKLVQRHFLATSNTNQQIAFSFVVRPEVESRLGTNDLSLVSTVEFLPGTVASKEKEAEKK